MPTEKHFSHTHRPHDGMFITRRKDLSFFDPEFNDFFNSIPLEIYEVGTETCRYNPVTDSITIKGFQRMPAFFFAQCCWQSFSTTD
jgi:hypothetical protein